MKTGLPPFTTGLSKFVQFSLVGAAGFFIGVQPRVQPRGGPWGEEGNI